jgi:UDP-N-acetylmuramate dehydrogenase
MEILENIALSEYSTMGLGGTGMYACTVSSRSELVEALQWAKARQVSTLMIGTGSNVIWRDEGYDGLLIINAILGYELLEQDPGNFYLRVGAGENWDSVVARSVADGLTGIEALSLIPGTVGATPIQNVGAYGQEVSQTITTIEAYDTVLNDYVIIRGFDCGFGYRMSRFKGVERGRFYITAVTYNLHLKNPAAPFYPAVQKYLDEQNLKTITPSVLRDAVIKIRSEKLPDPTFVHNSGSFFGNPIISQEQFKDIQLLYPTVPHWLVDQGIKLPAAWLIEQAGFKDVHDAVTGMGTWSHQALVLVNETAQTTAQLLAFKDRITDAVAGKFGVHLEQEPELLPL